MQTATPTPTHPLRSMVAPASASITDAELSELDMLLDVYNLEDGFDNSANFIICLSQQEVDDKIDYCCGVFSTNFKLSTGNVVFFAFDYGH